MADKVVAQAILQISLDETSAKRVTDALQNISKETEKTGKSVHNMSQLFNAKAILDFGKVAAQAIVQSLGDFETAVTSRRPSRIQDAIAAARAALAAYGTPVIRYQDGPELSLIELVLDYTERVILAGIGAVSGR